MASRGLRIPQAGRPPGERALPARGTTRHVHTTSESRAAEPGDRTEQNQAWRERRGLPPESTSIIKPCDEGLQKKGAPRGAPSGRAATHENRCHRAAGDEPELAKEEARAAHTAKVTQERPT